MASEGPYNDRQEYWRQRRAYADSQYTRMLPIHQFASHPQDLTVQRRPASISSSIIKLFSALTIASLMLIDGWCTCALLQRITDWYSKLQLGFTVYIYSFSFKIIMRVHHMIFYLSRGNGICGLAYKVCLCLTGFDV